mgnify:CR=1 FL=1
MAEANGRSIWHNPRFHTPPEAKNSNNQDSNLKRRRQRKENTAVKEEKKVITLTVAECMEFHSMGEFHENIKSVAEAVAKFKAIPPERMNGAS